MAGFDEVLAAFALSQADKDAARKQALMMMGLGLLGARKGQEGEALGRAGLLGMDAYQQSLTGAKQSKVDEYKLKQAWMQQQEADKKRAAEAADVAAVEQAKQAPWQAAAPWLAATGPVPKDDPLARYQRMAQATKNPANAKIYEELADKIAGRNLENEKRGDFSTTPHIGIGPDGQPTFNVINPRGEVKPLAGVAPPPKLHWVPQGDKITPVDELTVAPGTAYPVNMSPAEVVSNRIAQGNLVVNQETLKQRKAEHDAKLAADKAGGMASDKATDPQLAARGFLHRMRGAEEVVSGIEAGGYTPSFGTAYVEGMKRVPIIGGTAGGLASMARNAVSPEAGNYAQAQDDWIRAKLRKESGAVISPEEMEGERRTYFPQPGDSDALIKQKRLARKRAEEQMAIQAKESLVVRPGVSGGWSITPVN